MWRFGSRRSVECHAATLFCFCHDSKDQLREVFRIPRWATGDIPRGETEHRVIDDNEGGSLKRPGVVLEAIEARFATEALLGAFPLQGLPEGRFLAIFEPFCVFLVGEGEDGHVKGIVEVLTSLRSLELRPARVWKLRGLEVS